jgi:8-oxo-dGTP pyrophosphatase MutT (NUDIX family)
MTTSARQLLDELRRYQPADAIEEGHHRSLMSHLVHAKSPLGRSRYRPGHVTAGLFIVDPRSQRLLLHHHRRLDRWLPMGGHLEGSESPAEAALREGREESGLRDLQLVSGDIFDVDKHVIPATEDEPEHFHFDVRYVAQTNRPEAIAVDAGESKELAWFELDRALELMNDESSRRMVKKIRERIIGRGAPAR